MKRTIVAIDGPAGSGKSTVAKMLADKLSLAYVDTGATYRLVALRAMQSGVPTSEAAALAELAKETMQRSRLVDGRVLQFDGQPVGPEIRTPEVSEATSIVSAHPAVRSVLVAFQRSLVPPEGAVVEGRDIGTVVWPDADIKLFLDASPDVRAQRRTAEHGTPGNESVEIHERDSRDASRPVGPMRPARDAVIVDTSDLDAESVAEKILELMRPRRAPALYVGVRDLIKALLKVAFHFEVIGSENIPKRGGAILAPNHRSLIDIPVAAAVTKRHVRFMAKEELFKNSFAAWFIRHTGTFPVRRGRPDRSALLQSLAVLDAGDLLGIFPEGTRTPDARFDVLEEGFAYIALKSGAPILPVAISGTEGVFPPGRKMPKLVTIRASVGEPFRLGDRARDGIVPRSRIREATVEAQRRFAAVMNALEPR
ncbi:MAG: (d)CMP kinase [Actinomycetota bacterium]